MHEYGKANIILDKENFFLKANMFYLKTHTDTDSTIRKAYSIFSPETPDTQAKQLYTLFPKINQPLKHCSNILACSGIEEQNYKYNYLMVNCTMLLI